VKAILKSWVCRDCLNEGYLSVFMTYSFERLRRPPSRSFPIEPFKSVWPCRDLQPPVTTSRWPCSPWVGRGTDGRWRCRPAGTSSASPSTACCPENTKVGAAVSTGNSGLGTWWWEVVVVVVVVHSQGGTNCPFNKHPGYHQDIIRISWNLVLELE
jgi:hypothetical protein